MFYSLWGFVYLACNIFRRCEVELKIRLLQASHIHHLSLASVLASHGHVVAASGKGRRRDERCRRSNGPCLPPQWRGASLQILDHCYQQGLLDLISSLLYPYWSHRVEYSILVRNSSSAAMIWVYKKLGVLVVIWFKFLNSNIDFEAPH